jgi:hypothetical protein
VIYTAGRHTLLSPVNGSMMLFSLKEDFFHKTVACITIKSNSYGLGFENGEPVILGPGFHCIVSQTCK